MVLLANIPKRLLWGLAVAILAAAAFLLWLMPQIGQGQSPQETVIDTSANVEAMQCASCHVELGAAKRPGLIFNHGNHLVVSCAGCHYEMPHKDGATYAVPMEVCFTCHGLQHGPVGELATSDCKKCHTPSFELKPRNHRDDWAKKPHAVVGKREGVNGCMMCHKAEKDCDVCHNEEEVDVGPMPPTYQSVIIEKPKATGVKIYPSQPASMSQCVYCHPDLDNFKPGRLIFAHGTHLERNYKCTVCHSQFAHSPEQIQKPDMLSCYRCHGLVHAGQGLVATEACDKCHPPKFGLKPADHTKAFVKGSHKKRAAREGEYCAMCHQANFCVDCHQGRKAGKGGPAKPVIPKDHKDARWLGAHGKLFLAREGACGSCHDDPSCKRCHQTVMPHPTDWLTSHSRAGRADPKDCDTCHTNRSTCQECHHSKVMKGYLVESECVPCHKEARQKPPTAIKNKGIAEHAVHFNVAKTKGRPYKCYECHVSFGTSARAQKAAAQQGHDLRLCYGCHGALDPFNVQIAPYPGAQLCFRCHSDLNI